MSANTLLNHIHIITHVGKLSA